MIWDTRVVLCWGTQSTRRLWGCCIACVLQIIISDRGEYLQARITELRVLDPVPAALARYNAIYMLMAYSTRPAAGACRHGLSRARVLSVLSPCPADGTGLRRGTVAGTSEKRGAASHRASATMCAPTRSSPTQ